MIGRIRAIGRTMVGIAPAYGHQIWFSIKQQVVLVVLASLVLDTGQTSCGMAAVMIGYWIGTAIIVMRRPLSPSKGDLVFVRWGCSLLAAAIVFMCLVRAVFVA